MKGTGYIPSPPDERDFPLVGTGGNALFGALDDYVPVAHLPMIAHLDGINDQGGSSSCVWQGMQQQHYVALGVHGVRSRRRLSVMFGYHLTRRRGGTQLVDGGCVPRLAWKVAADSGFCPEDLWPFNEAEINRPPSLDAVAGAIDQRWVEGYYHILGSPREDEVRQALSSNHPLVFGTIIDQSFGRYKGSGLSTDPMPPPSGNTGRHMMCAVGYDQDGLWVVNSWGRWGCGDPTGRFDHGFFHMSWEWVNWYGATDWWAIRYPKMYV